MLYLILKHTIVSTLLVHVNNFNHVVAISRYIITLDLFWFSNI